MINYLHIAGVHSPNWQHLHTFGQHLRAINVPNEQGMFAASTSTAAIIGRYTNCVQTIKIEKNQYR